MDKRPANEPAHAKEPVRDSAPHYHGFWPVLLIGGSLALILIWEIQVASYTRHNTEQLREQQLHVVDQAKQVQANLEKLVHGLVDLSATDEAAKRIVTKFGIKMNSPTPAPAPAP